MAPLLRVRNLHVSYDVYGKRYHVLNGVEMEVNEREKVGLIGESGTGKTTTLRSIMRILPYNAKIEGGEIYFKKTNVLAASKKELVSIRRKSMAMIFQDPTAALNPVFKIKEQLGDIVRYSRMERGENTDKKEIHEEMVKLLKDVRLPDPERILDSYPFQLSGGMRQRVMIAMALASGHELILADEPTTNLDVTIQDQILKLLKKLVDEKKLSLILVSHALGAVRGMVDKVYVMYAGTIIESGPTESVFEDPKHPYTQLLLKSVPKLTGEGISEGIPGRIPDYSEPPQGCRFHPRCPFVKPECKVKKPITVDVGGNHKVACFLYE